MGIATRYGLYATALTTLSANLWRHGAATQLKSLHNIKGGVLK